MASGRAAAPAGAAWVRWGQSFSDKSAKKQRLYASYTEIPGIDLELQRSMGLIAHP
jgi:hypothetical protein